MKNTFLLLVFLSLPFTLSADCAFGFGSIIDHTQTEYFIESEGLVWIGEYVEEIIDETNFFKATKFRVIEIWCGDIITNPSADAPDHVQPYVNNEEFIWLVGGYGTSQDEYYSEGKTLFASPHWGWGYGTSACSRDWILLDNNEELVSPIEHAGTSITTLHDLKDVLLLETCETANGIESLGSVEIYPNPVSDAIYLPLELLDRKNTEAAIYNTRGQRIALEQHLTSGAIDVSRLNTGIYYISFYEKNKIIGNAQFIKL